MSVLGVLLEGFDETAHPRGFHGRWIGKPGGKVLRVFHGSASLGDAKPERGKLLSNVAQVAQDAGRSMTPAEARKVVNDAVGSPAPTPRVIPKGGNANELRGGIPQVPVERLSDDILRRQAAGAASSRARGLAQQELDRRRGAQTPRPRVRGDGRSGPIAPSAPALGHPDDPSNPNRQQARDAQLHSQTVRHLENLPQGGYLHVAGVANGGAIARRTAAGFEVYRANQAKPDKVHKTPSAAAAHMVRIRKAGLAPVREAQPMVLGALLEGR